MLIFILSLVMATGLYLIWTAITGDKADQNLLRRFEVEELDANAKELAAAFAVQSLENQRGLLNRLTNRTGLSARQLQKAILIGLPGALIGGLLAAGLWGWPVMIGLGTVAGAVAPLWLMASRASSQRLVFEEDLATAVDTLASLISAGLGISSAVKALANTGPERLQSEFATIYEEASFFGLKAALELAQDRKRNPQFDLVALSLITADATGGEVAERMKRLARTIRANLSITRQALAEQTGQVISARLVAFTPLGVLTIIKTFNSDYVQAYDSDLGQIALMAGLTLIVLGYVLMRWFGRLPVPRRTFSGNRRAK